MFEQQTVVPIANPAESLRQERSLWAPVVRTTSWKEWNLSLALEGGKSERVHRPFYSRGRTHQGTPEVGLAEGFFCKALRTRARSAMGSVS